MASQHSRTRMISRSYTDPQKTQEVYNVEMPTLAYFQSDVRVSLRCVNVYCATVLHNKLRVRPLFAIMNEHSLLDLRASTLLYNCAIAPTQ